MKYKEVPDIITGKDLDYLTDMFNWHYIAFKNSVNNEQYINNSEISEILNESIELLDKNMNIILDILGGYNDK